MLKALFVDDEPYVLEALRDMLRPFRHRWSLSFASSGAEALQMLERANIDMVVTDMRMPQMDGAQLLTELRLRHPHVMRAVLTGQSDIRSAERLLPVAQQMILKPCDRGRLEDVLSRAERIRALLPEENVRACVGRIERLPPAPRIYASLVTAIEMGDASAKDIADIIASEPAMSAKLLQLANSSFFRLARKIKTPEEAVVHLGFLTVRNLVLSVEVFESADPLPASSGLNVDRLRRHAVLVGRIASRICPPDVPGQAAFLAGVLHEIGLLVFGVGDAREMAKTIELAQEKQIPLIAAEREIIHATHAQAGAYLLGLWGLPLELMEAVATHDDPWPLPRTMDPALDLCTITHIASALANAQMTISARLEPQEHLDPELIEALGAKTKIEKWRAIATEEAAQST